MRAARHAGVYQWMRRYQSEGVLGLMDAGNALMTAEPTPAAGDGVDEPRRQVEALRPENAVMRETIKVFKADDPRLDPSVPANRERTRVVDAIGSEFGLKAVLDAVGLKRGTYYYERGVIAAGDGYAAPRARVAAPFEDGGRVRGYRTIHRMPRLDETDPLVVSEKVVRRIMREEGPRPVYLKRPKRWSSYEGEIGEAPANPVERDFHTDAPNMPWGRGRHPVRHGRVQVPAVPGGRPLRRDGRLLDAVALPGRRHGESDAPRRGRHAQGRGASNRPFRPRPPLPAARMDPHPRGARANPVDERQGMQPGQHGSRGVLRQAQERVLPRARPEGRGLRGVPRMPDGLPDPLQ